MRSSVSVEAAQLDKCRVVLALLEAREELAAPWDDMGDLIDEAAIVEQHQHGVRERAAFDAELEAAKARQIGDPRRRGPAEHDRHRGEMIGLARHQSSKLDRAPAVGGSGADKIRHSGRFHSGLPEGALDQRIAANEPAPAIGEKRVDRQCRAVVRIRFGLEPLNGELPAHPQGDRIRNRQVEAAPFGAVIHGPRRDVRIEAHAKNLLAECRSCQPCAEQQCGGQHGRWSPSCHFPPVRT